MIIKVYSADIFYMKRTIFLSAFLISFFCGLSFAQNALLIKPSDLRLIPETSGLSEKTGDFEKIIGYHLYIRKLPEIESVMLTETTKDPDGKSDNYAYRALEYNQINGDEIRFL